MKTNYKHVPLILLVLMVILQLNFVSAQNVGIGTATPTEKLDVFGNLKFTGALMPNNLPGTTGRILMSAGPGIAPTWGPTLVNTPAITNIGKFYVGPPPGPALNLPANTILTLAVADPLCVPGSQISVSWAGLLPGTAAQNSNIRIYNVQTGTGQFVVVIANLNVAVSYNNVVLAFTAVY
jgi:hypothetical protein